MRYFFAYPGKAQAMNEGAAGELRKHISGFCDWLSASGYTRRTVRSYRNQVLFFARWVEERPELGSLSDLTTSVLTNFFIELATEPGGGRDGKGTLRSSNTVAGYITALLKLFEFFLKSGFVLLNPMREVERPRNRRPLPKDILTLEEFLKILAHLDVTTPRGLRNRAIFELLYATGLRRFELEGLDVASVLFQERLIRVKGKGGKERLVPLGDEAWRVLTEYLGTGRPRMKSKGSQALFLSTRGGRVKMAVILRDLRIAAKRAGVSKRVTLHGIRHSVATHLLAQGADIRHIQVFLGHAQLSTTQVYTRVEVSDLKDMLDRYHPRDKF